MPTFGGIVVATGTEADGRRTLLDVITELSLPVDPDDDRIKALAADAFRAAVRTMNRKGCWPWELLDEDLTMTVNEKFSTVASAVKKPLAMHFLTGAGGTRKRRMSYRPYEEFVEKYSMDFSSEPHTYTIPNLFETGQIRWHPIPASTENMRLTYYRVTPSPRTEQQPVEIPDMALEAYMAFAWYEFMKRLPSTQRPFPIDEAGNMRDEAFREISAHVVQPGDRSRQVAVGGYGHAGGIY